MATGGSYDTSGADLLLALRPRDSWTERARQKQAELQYASLLGAQAREQTAALEGQIASQIQLIGQIKAMPVEAPDQARIGAYVNGMLGKVLRSIDENYGGDPRRFLEAEGRITLSKMKDDFMASPLYAQVTRNKYEMDLARKAMSAGKALIGGLDASGHYEPAEQAIYNFQNGMTERFTFRGAYEPSQADAFAFFSRQYAPAGSRYQRTPVGELEKLQFAVSALGEHAGRDHYFRSLRGRNIYYKADPLEDAQLAQLSAWNQSLSAQQKIAKINESKNKAAKGHGGNKPYMDDQFGNPIGQTRAFSIDNETAVVPEFGVKLTDLASKDPVTGQKRLIFNQLSNLTGHEYTSRLYGTWGKEAQIKGGVLPENGGHSIHLEGVPHQVIRTEPSVYVPEKDFQKNLQGRPGQYFQKVTVEIPEQAAKSAGLINNFFGWDWTETTSKASTGLRRGKGNSVIMDLYVPLPRYGQNRELDNLATKRLDGQKMANETVFSTAPAFKIDDDQ
ncbi:hypothetical protein [Dyadobacter sp. BHUBP1]|uniref:hypothetical protein n=1 Tax=Dyadobacter sp. BHUBP1 TaxID=3424178 RepID=UPI003D341332